MDWFEKITGFAERDYAQTRQKLQLVDGAIVSRANGTRYGVGRLELASLGALRERAALCGSLPASVARGPLKVSIVEGDVRAMHSAPAHAGALFQVASQFNLLEMPGPSVTPEDGVAGYQYDKTQGPACAMAAGAATIFRNYFAPVNGQSGQTSERQIDALAALGEDLASLAGCTVSELWAMENGYALCTKSGLARIVGVLDNCSAEQTDALRARLHVGVHSNVHVTDAGAGPDQRVSQIFCSALPVAYSSIPAEHWRSFATLILEATYEATMWAAILNAQQSGSNLVFLTSVGGGAFGNNAAWIDGAMRRALGLVSTYGLDVRLVSYGPPSAEMAALVRDFT